MDEFLCFGTTFISNRYHGKEWPPAPARLFQALLAGANTGRYKRDWTQVEPALRFLEGEVLTPRPAPEVLARDAQDLPPYCIPAPNNDEDSSLQERKLKPVLPFGFPLDPNGAPHVYYFWNVTGEDVPTYALSQLASYLHTFGWGIDMAYASCRLVNEKEKQALTEQTDYSHYVPAKQGKLRKIPRPGYLQNLKSAYDRYCNPASKKGVDPATRATKYGQERYQRVGGFEFPVAKFVLRMLDNSDTPYAVPWALGMKVAAWMRHAAAESLRQEGRPEDFINSYMLGHGNGRSKHMSFVPVPNVGTIYPDGAIRRVMVVEPPDGDGGIAELLQWKLATSVLHRLVENGGGPRKTEAVCQLFEAENDNIWRYYMRSSSLWHSVTPVILHGYNSEHKIFSLKKTERLLYQAFEESGYSHQSIMELFFQPAPLWAGTEGALTFRVPEHLAKWPRYHVAVRFREPLAGPVLVGIGRHYGIGLFAAPRD